MHIKSVLTVNDSGGEYVAAVTKKAKANMSCVLAVIMNILAMSVCLFTPIHGYQHFEPIPGYNC